MFHMKNILFFRNFESRLYSFFKFNFQKMHLMEKLILEMNGADVRNPKMMLFDLETYFVTLHCSTQSATLSEDHPVTWKENSKFINNDWTSKIKAFHVNS